MTRPHLSPGLPTSPDLPLNCLIIQPAFSKNNYWNYVESARSIGAGTVAPPLGLLTVAALLPQHWSMKFVDLNVRELPTDIWQWADLVCVGGMLPQQPTIMQIIDRALADNKFVVVGGADPTSQPEVYEPADARVLGEGELSIPIWLESWRNGQPRGLFQSATRPDVTVTPPPRFDLLDFNDYIHVGVQFSRGCPFNCEFCDIIELYGRVPRVKTAAQFINELQHLYELGYRGWIDVVDDNFIGNRKLVKPMLKELAEWSRARKYPFFFSTEATMNLADDDELLAAMQDADFRYVFMGIETPDPDLLALTQKRVNAMKPIVDRVQRIYDAGMTVAAGFIFGFDEEPNGNDKTMISCIEDTGIVIAMVGLLVALPNTQLTARLQREGRLLSPDLQLVPQGDEPYRIMNTGKFGEGEDNQAAGLNFVTSRDRVTIYEEYKNVIDQVYAPNHYLYRAFRTARRLRPRYRHQPGWWEWKRNLRGLFSTMVWMTRNRETRFTYWSLSWKSIWLGLDRFDYFQRMASLYMHFHNQTQFLKPQLDINIDFARHHAAYPRSVADMQPQGTAIS